MTDVGKKLRLRSKGVMKLSKTATYFKNKKLTCIHFDIVVKKHGIRKLYNLFQLD